MTNGIVKFIPPTDEYILTVMYNGKYLYNKTPETPLVNSTINVDSWIKLSLSNC